METYTVTITGDISEYQRREDAIAAFAKLFSIPMAQAENTINKAPDVHVSTSHTYSF